MLAPSLSGGRLLFNGDDGVSGNEAWRLFPGATAQIIGQPCGGSMPRLSANDPVLGQAWRLRGASTPAGVSTVLLIGASARDPRLLGSGCVTWLEPDAALLLDVFDAGASDWERSFAVPDDPVLIGGTCIVQFVCLPTASPAGFDLSNGVAATFGR